MATATMNPIFDLGIDLGNFFVTRRGDAGGWLWWLVVQTGLRWRKIGGSLTISVLLMRQAFQVCGQDGIVLGMLCFQKLPQFLHAGGF